MQSGMSTECSVEESRGDDSKQYVACFVVVTALVALTAALSVFWLLLPRERQDDLASTFPPGPLCQSSQCASAVDIFKAIMKPEVDPCHDFYAYVCGNFKHPLGQILGQMDEQMYQTLAQTLDSASSLPSRGQSAAQKAATLYQNCAEGRADDTEALRKFAESVGLGLHTYAGAEALDKIIMLFFKYNIAILLELSLEDAKLTRRKRLLVLTTSTAHLRWMSERGKNAPLELFYLLHMKAFGLQPFSDKARRMAENITRTETTALGVYFFDRAVTKAQFTAFAPVGRLDALTPSMPPGRWASLISSHSGGVYGAEDEVQVTVSALAYIDRLHVYLGKELNLLAAWELVRSLVPLTSRAMVIAFYRPEFIKSVCLFAVARAMEVPLFSWYLFKEVTHSTVASALDMTDHIRKLVMEEIDSSTWLDKATKTTAMYKVHDMELQAGYPTFFNSEKEIDLAYRSYPDVGKNFLAPWLDAMGRTVAWRVTNHSSFYFSVKESNAAYAPFRNKMVLRAPILRPPMFSPALPKAVNYGALGGVIGHEITHAFDLQGSQLDGHGRERNWWSNHSREQYAKRVDCLRRSHGDTDNVAMSENMADFGGAVSSHQAFSGHGDRTTLPGLKYNADQLFFVATCLKWCATTRALHPVYYASWANRCNVPLKNMKAFADAFECPVGADMNPESRCAFW